MIVSMEYRTQSGAHFIPAERGYEEMPQGSSSQARSSSPALSTTSSITLSGSPVPERAASPERALERLSVFEEDEVEPDHAQVQDHFQSDHQTKEPPRFYVRKSIEFDQDNDARPSRHLPSLWNPSKATNEMRRFYRFSNAKNNFEDKNVVPKFEVPRGSKTKRRYQAPYVVDDSDGESFETPQVPDKKARRIHLSSRFPRNVEDNDEDVLPLGDPQVLERTTRPYHFSRTRNDLEAEQRLDNVPSPFSEGKLKRDFRLFSNDSSSSFKTPVTPTPLMGRTHIRETPSSQQHAPASVPPYFEYAAQAAAPKKARKMPADVIVIDSDSDMDDGEILEHGLDPLLHRREQQRPRGRRIIISQRNPPIQLPCVEIEKYEWNGATLRTGKTVELKDGSFLYIRAIFQDLTTGETVLRGWVLKRCFHLNGLLPNRMNELCFVFEVDSDDARPVAEQSVQEVRLEDVVQIRRLIRTNLPFPEGRTWKADAEWDVENPRQFVLDHEVLIARWKFTSLFRNAQKRVEFGKLGKYTRFQSRKIESLTEEECTKGYQVSAQELKRAWRGPTAKGGSARVLRPETEGDFPCPMVDCNRGFFDAEALFRHAQAAHQDQEIDHARRLGNDSLQGRYAATIANSGVGPAVKLNDEPLATSRKYTFGDGFCCGGGISSAAKMAGLQLSWGFDNDPKTSATYKANFPESTHYLMDVNEFSNPRARSKQLYVDILHWSSVCDYFSPNKTHRGCVGDDDKEATLFCGRKILDTCRPRIATVEQTFGLIERYPEHFNALVSDLTVMGYSVSWQVVKFQNKGAPQRRRRLILVASCPGEALPELPADTHSEHGTDGLKRFTSVNSVLARVPRNAPNHDLRGAMVSNLPPWDGSKIINCIVRNGTIAHPHGGRRLTHRELAALQTFPMNHVFIGNQGDIRNMIGNAVPPGVMKLFFVAIRKHLEKTDGIEA